MSLTVNSLDVMKFILGTKNFAVLYDNVPITKRKGLKGGHLSTMFCVFYKDHVKYC